MQIAPVTRVVSFKEGSAMYDVAMEPSNAANMTAALSPVKLKSIILTPPPESSH